MRPVGSPEREQQLVRVLPADEAVHVAGAPHGRQELVAGACLKQLAQFEPPAPETHAHVA